MVDRGTRTCSPEVQSTCNRNSILLRPKCNNKCTASSLQLHQFFSSLEPFYDRWFWKLFYGLDWLQLQRKWKLAFKEFVLSNCLFEVRFNTYGYTWIRQCGKTSILDSSLVNAHWMENYDQLCNVLNLKKFRSSRKTF